MDITEEFDPLSEKSRYNVTSIEKNKTLSENSNFPNVSGLLLSDFVTTTDTYLPSSSQLDRNGSNITNNNVQKQSPTTSINSKTERMNSTLRPLRRPPPPPLKTRTIARGNSLVDLDPKFVDLQMKESTSTRSFSSFYVDAGVDERKPTSQMKSSVSNSSFYSDSSPDVASKPLPVTKEPRSFSAGSLFYDLKSGEVGSEFGGREQIMQLCMAKRQEEYTIRQPFKVFVGTWNVNGQIPPSDVSQWLLSDDLMREPPDIYIIGFQELDLSKEAYVFSASGREEDWIKVVSRSLPDNIKYLKSVRLIGMMLLVYVQIKHSESITNVTVHQVGTGILGRMGNKGGVSLRMDVHNSSICAVNSHLAAHMEQCRRRNEDFHDICSRLRFAVPGHSIPLTILQHDVVFWLGDLNYRIQDMKAELVKEYIDECGYKFLQEKDQLTVERGLGNVFRGFSEGELNFRPTYKYNPGTDDWDTSDKCRTPAWCDRVLWWETPQIQENNKTKPILSVDLLKYQQHMPLKISDHKPVSALFLVKVKVIDGDQYKKVFEEEIRRLDKLENEYLPSMKLNAHEVNFGEVKFQQPKLVTLEITNDGQRPCNFSFINRPGEQEFCKKWLTITKPEGCLLQGETFMLEFEVYVNRVTAPMLNSGEETLEDILILHLHGGKDFFITVSGRYLPSCFGMSIEALCRLKKPIRYVEREKVQRLSKIQPNRAADLATEENETTLAVPKELWILVDHLARFAKQQAELFQQPGLHSEVEEIRDFLDSTVNTTNRRMKLPGSNHSAAEALLIFLEALPEPVIPFKLYKHCLGVCDVFHLCKQVLQDATNHHRNVFKYITAFLRELIKYRDENGLEVDLVAQVFSGLILRPSPQIKKHGLEARVERECSQRFLKHFLVNEYDE